MSAVNMWNKAYNNQGKDGRGEADTTPTTLLSPCKITQRNASPLNMPATQRASHLALRPPPHRIGKGHLHHGNFSLHNTTWIHAGERES